MVDALLVALDGKELHVQIVEVLPILLLPVPPKLCVDLNRVIDTSPIKHRMFRLDHPCLPQCPIYKEVAV
jgi:hypothetical protein